METHFYDDPEENDWVLPDTPDPVLVPDNTFSFGPLYFWRGIANPAQTKVSVAVTREITDPWRRGLGVSWRSSRSTGGSWAIGIWLRGTPPRILRDTPVEQDWREVVQRANELAES